MAVVLCVLSLKLVFSTHNYNKMMEVSFTEYVVVIVRYQGLRLHFVRLRPNLRGDRIKSSYH